MATRAYILTTIGMNFESERAWGGAILRFLVLNVVDGNYKLSYIVAHTGGLKYGC